MLTINIAAVVRTAQTLIAHGPRALTIAALTCVAAVVLSLPASAAPLIPHGRYMQTAAPGGRVAVRHHRYRHHRYRHHRYRQHRGYAARRQAHRRSAVRMTNNGRYVAMSGAAARRHRVARQDRWHRVRHHRRAVAQRMRQHRRHVVQRMRHRRVATRMTANGRYVAMPRPAPQRRHVTRFARTERARSHRRHAVQRVRHQRVAARMTANGRYVAMPRPAPHRRHLTRVARTERVRHHRRSVARVRGRSAYAMAYAGPASRRHRVSRTAHYRTARYDAGIAGRGLSFGSSLVAEARRYIGGNPTSRRSLWCARFMNMVLKRTGHRTTGSDMALSFARYGRRVSGPRVGAIAVFSRGGRRGHVGVVSGIDKRGNPIVISGNYRNRVAEATYRRGTAIAYVMPE